MLSIEPKKSVKGPSVILTASPTEKLALNLGAPIWATGKGQWFDQSPIRYAKNWKTPMLVTQGEQDFRVPISESMTTFKLLQRLKVPARFVIFPDEGHWILKGPNSKKHMEEVLAWLRKYLGDPEP